MADTHDEDFKRNNIGNAVHNLESFIVRFIALIKSFVTEPVPVFDYVLQGLDDELKKSDGNLGDDATGALEGTTTGLINGLHRIQTHDTGQNLSGK